MNRREWATALGAVCSPSFPADGAEALVDMLPLLGDFPDRAFNQETINLIGRMRRRQSIPALDEVSAGLGTWCKENRVADVFRLSAPDSDLPALDAAGRSWLETWEREKAAGFPAKDGTPRYPNVFPDTPSNHSRAHLASLIRRLAPNAWKHIAAGPECHA
jgi:hypothetical protein